VAGPVNIASGKGVTITDVARMIGVDISAGESSPSPARLVADVSRLRGEVGFTPRYDLESGLADTVTWWRAML
jgi:nucleoside-diphosphate-sugar epimerase